jgi:hypothetical protein
MPPDTVFEKEHHTIIDAIDDAYNASIMGMTEIQSWLQKNRGMPRDIIFMKFYKPFMFLFKATCKSPSMNKNQELIGNINMWLSGTEIDTRRIKLGFKLFEAYQEQLFNTGVINIKR